MRRVASSIESREAGYVLPAVIALVVVLTAVTLGVMQAGQSGSDARVQRLDALRLDQIAQTGFDRYRAALNSNRVGVVNGYQPTLEQWSSLVQPRRGESRHRTSQWAARPAFARRDLHLTGGVRLDGDRAVTIRFPVDNGLFGYFSPVAILPPASGRPMLTMYANVWIAPRNERRVLASRLAHASFRPTYFSDYQLLTDGPILLDDARISAPVFTNGFDDAFLVETMLAGNDRLEIAPRVTCSGNASLSTGRGSIRAGGSCANAIRRPNTGAFVNILRARDSLNAITAACGRSATVHCWPGNTPRTVTLNGSNVRVSGAGSWSVANDPRVFWFNADATVHGTLSSGSATIAVRGAGGSGITLRGPDSVGASDGGAANGRAVVGLLSDGHVETDLDSCPSRINAAIASAGGGLSLPSRYRTAFGVGSGGLPHCGDVTVFGSVAGHAPPILRLGVGSGWVGYRRRSFRFNPTLAQLQPPAWPLTDGGWSITSQGPGNLDCLSQIATLRSAACA